MITELNESYQGKKITCRIMGDLIEDGIIYIAEDECFYIFQNVVDGSIPIGFYLVSRGYKYSWCVGTGIEDRLSANKVTDLQLKTSLSKFSVDINKIKNIL